MVEEDRDLAIKKVTAISSAGVEGLFVDGSAGNRKVGIGVYSRALRHDGTLITKRHTRLLGSQEKLTAQYAELGALAEALNLFISSWGQSQDIPTMRVYCDCKSALSSLQNPRRQNGQSILSGLWKSSERYKQWEGQECNFGGSWLIQRWKETRKQISWPNRPQQERLSFPHLSVWHHVP